MNIMTREIFDEAFNAGLDYAKTLNRSHGTGLYDGCSHRWGTAEAIGRKKILAKYGISYAQFKEFRKTIKSK